MKENNFTKLWHWDGSNREQPVSSFIFRDEDCACCAQGPSAGDRGQGSARRQWVGHTSHSGVRLSPCRTHHEPQSPLEDEGGQGTMVLLGTFCFCTEASEYLRYCSCIVPRNSGTFWQSQSLECFKWSSCFAFCLYFPQSCLIDSNLLPWTCSLQ